ncbi:Phospholipase, patatin [Bibersteinia trehalosi USDA-ARS-USMARC-188]|uniref:Phospholipase, patatin n=3 Tax=Bibersteinia trehalosi TaxID=47735 RepID=A0A4V7ICU5_BIBTR|nr:patatin-like phospholipase family protein [Bibersteinia trehalosi]AGH37351.1 Phospholipase, patatin [Bibersteinia trehalosi USDA-ARS-USMARC-192]AHG82801.1 Phospholipase, patatin [Bibersteinia trehalosi USDA-ARS-USMARC-188]AHG85175.1 Phospholipase, patatin [Bibersteinia trehalosi USDA-ARS-USMARC-189]RRN05848.1 patatin [Bibersteinia trehalosi]
MQQYSIGLVLSGGGHKGLVHAGVLQFLQEQKIEPQIFSGTSAGALISSLYAVGKSPREILEFFRSVNLFNVHHFSLAKNGLLNAEKFMVYLEQVFGELRVGDLPKEVYISATNIETAKPKIFSPQTKLKEAVAASCAFPGVFSPIMVEGKLYSDGGILNNFPANVIQGRCDFVIGVNLDCGLDYKPANKFAFAPQTAWRAIEIMMSQNSAMQNRFCDWLINPKDVNQYSVFELSSKRLDAIFNLGYQTAKREFAKLNPSIFG